MTDFRETKIKILSVEHSRAFQEAVFAAGGGWSTSEQDVKFPFAKFLFVGTNLNLSYEASDREYFNCHKFTEIQFPLPTKDNYTKHKEITMKQIIVNVGDLTIEEKQRVNEALAKIKNIKVCYPMYWESVEALYGASRDVISVGFGYYEVANPTHTVQQVLEMAGMTKGHIHSENMALYAEDAKTHSEPWKLWQTKGDSNTWRDCRAHPMWWHSTEYRRKPKTKLIHGTEVPDLSFTPLNGEDYYCICLSSYQLVKKAYHSEGCMTTKLRAVRGLCYPDTADGKRAAILHGEALLNID